MARHTEIEPALPTAFHLAHRYVHGLRLDGIWEYRVRTAAGTWRWKALPLLEAKASLDDPDGAWWCVRRCAALMAQQGLHAIRLPTRRAPAPETTEVVQVLQAMLPRCKVHQLDIDVENPIVDLAQVLEGRGCALLRLDRGAGANGASTACWLWMVGIETRYQVLLSGQRLPSTEGLRHALLVVGPRWPAPWGSGFGAKVLPLEDGSWRFSSVDGEVLRGRLKALSVVRPVAAD